MLCEDTQAGQHCQAGCNVVREGEALQMYQLACTGWFGFGRVKEDLHWLASTALRFLRLSGLGVE
jgi:hypothetical protein